MGPHRPPSGPRAHRRPRRGRGTRIGAYRDNGDPARNSRRVTGSSRSAHAEAVEVALAVLALDVAAHVDAAHPQLVLAPREPLRGQAPARGALGPDVDRAQAAAPARELPVG